MVSVDAANNLATRTTLPKYLAAFTLFLLPAISVELLTGDTSLAKFLNPVAFVVLTITYGGALLLVRETAARWNKGFASIIVLAAAYGMVNEAICSKGFFDPHFYAVVENGLEGFGRWFGINVTWALSISIFHATFSIIVPLIIVSAIFPDSARPEPAERREHPQRWIGNRLYTALLIVFVALMGFSCKVFSPAATHYKYNEGPGPITLILSLIALDILIAWKLPPLHPRRWRLRIPTPAFFLLGAIFAFAYFPSAHILRATNSPVVYVCIDLAAFVALPVGLLCKLPEPSPRAKVALVAGLLVPMLAVGRGAGAIFAATIVITLLIIAFIRTGRRNAEPYAMPRNL